MHDIRFIRENWNVFVNALKKRGVAPNEIPEMALEIDEQTRKKTTELQELQQRRNSLSREIGEIKKSGGNADALMQEVTEIKGEMTALESAELELYQKLNTELMGLPNILDDAVPNGNDESDNVELRRHGNTNPLPFTPLDHIALGEGLGLMDFGRAAKLSGSRFVVLKGALAKLERALATFMLDTHCEKFGYQEILPPFLVNSTTMQGTGQLPKFADDLFQTKDDRWLIPTAEVPLTNLVADSILDASELPLRFTAYTPCFRSEAGAAGKDTKGMIRQHQFSKVELVSIVHPDQSEAELERMTNCAETILQELKLPYRVVDLCAGDVGFSAARTHDIEVWLPGQDNGNGNGNGKFREISSCSNCRAFQARRMKARFRAKNEKETQFVHTLNGSGLAVGRTLIAVLENGQQEDGSIKIPEALHPYMGGITTLTSVKD